MNIRGVEVEIDYEEEVLQFDWYRMRIRGNKLQACSPFRDEKTPSFAVNLENGLWIDSGAETEEWRKGNFISLLSFLRNETWQETELYLMEKYYQIGFVDTEELSLDFSKWNKKEKGEYKILDKSILDKFKYRHSYLEKKRGIEPIYQDAVHIGYDKENKGISIPLFDKDNNLVNIKFRSVQNKRFWYYEEGQPVRNHLWGLHLVYIKQSKKVWIVESEIDALTLWKHKCPAIAVMGSALTKKQKKLLIDSPIEEIVIATDNDKAGKRLSKSINSQLNGLLYVSEMTFDEKYKDVNDIPTDELIETIKGTKDRFLDW